MINKCSLCNKVIKIDETETLGMCEDCVEHWKE